MTTPSPLFSRRLLILSGKGGVGRTTAAAALARAATRAGRSVLVAQMDAHDRLAHLFGHATRIGSEITPVDERLFAVNMNARDALHEYALMVLKYETLYRALFENRAVRGFLSAIPGLDAYAMLGKAWWHTTEMAGGRPKYDLVIIDGPASGHATTMLRTPQAILDAIPKGPLSADAAAIRSMLSDPARCAFVIVTLAEELPAKETAQLARTAREDLHLPLGPLFVNGVPSAEFAHPALFEITSHVTTPTGDARLDASVVGASLLARRRKDAEAMLSKLGEDPGLPLIELPRLATTDLGPADVRVLADAIERGLQSSTTSV